jgi:hypothetical protein
MQWLVLWSESLDVIFELKYGSSIVDVYFKTRALMCGLTNPWLHI